MKETAQKTRSKKLFKQHTELEILVSAAIVFAAVNSRDVVLNLTYELLNSNIPNNSFFLGSTILIGLIAATIFPISIVTHLVLRSYWLALVGLRLAFEDAELKPLKFAEPYNTKIKKYIDLDLQIKKMDKITSSVFSFSFLILFSFLFSLIFLMVVVTTLNLLSGVLGDADWAGTVLLGLVALIGICSILYAIDFFGLGVLKKIKRRWFQRIYYPIYKFFSLITFATLYRGIYYTLIMRVSRGVVFTVLPLYVIITLIAINLGYNSYMLYPSKNGDDEVIDLMYIRAKYRDELTARTPVFYPLIQSRIITDSHIRLFIPFGLEVEDSLKANCLNIKPFDERGFHWQEYFSIDGQNTDELDYREVGRSILSCVRDNIQVTLADSTLNDLEYRFSRITEPDRAGVETIFSVKWLKTGNHVLKLSAPQIMGEKDMEIPFFKD